MDKLTVRDLEPAGKRVFLRVDFNVPLEDGKVTDDSRIRAAIPTIAYLLEAGASLVLASHLGRPNGKVVDTYRLRPVAERLSALIRRHVPVTGDALGVGTNDAIRRLKPGELLLLENLRFHGEEERNDRAFAQTLAGYADVYVNDAFGTAHRAHASTVGITEFLPAYAGLLMEREIRMLSGLLESPDRPFAAVIGGAKVSGKIKVLDNLMQRVDTFVIGGGMANTFLVAQGHTVGKSLLERDRVEDAGRILANAEKRKTAFLLPSDVVVAKEVTRGAEHKIVPVARIPNSWSVVDVGPESRIAFEAALEDARTILWNGPLGVFEVPTFGDGTRAMARYLARRADAGATVVVGGGDSVAAIEQLGLTPKMTHISTGGGASLEFLEGRELPGIAALLDRPAPEKPKPAPRKKPALSKVAARAKVPARAAVSARARVAPAEAAPAKATPAKAKPVAPAKVRAIPAKAVTTKAKPVAAAKSKATPKAAPAKAAPKPTPKPTAKSKVQAKPAPKSTAKAAPARPAARPKGGPAKRPMSTTRTRS
jgi:phosphoglycerate kinase